MGKIRYQFNPKSLQIERVDHTIAYRLRKLATYVGIAIVFSVLSVTIAFSVIDSPKEKALKRDIAQYRLQNEIVNDRLDKILVVLEDLQHRDDNIYRVIFGAEPVPEGERIGGIGGVDRYKHLEGYSTSEEMIKTMKRIDEVSKKMVVQSKSFDRVFDMAKRKEEMMASIPAIVPIKNGAKHIVSGFGYRMHPIYRYRRMHTGVDIAVKKGTPVYASGDGKVINSNTGMGGYGIVVIIDHGFGYQSLYAHLSKKAVRPGQKIKRGQLIGYVGSTGLSVASHLHYEVIHHGKKVNPIHYFYNDLKPDEYEEVIKLASKENQPLS